MSCVKLEHYLVREEQRVGRMMPAVPKEVAETGLQQLESWKYVQHRKQVSMHARCTCGLLSGSNMPNTEHTELCLQKDSLVRESTG